jgi:cysteine desulfurase/selenocysteine lyase
MDERTLHDALARFVQQANAPADITQHPAFQDFLAEMSYGNGVSQTPPVPTVPSSEMSVDALVDFMRGMLAETPSSPTVDTSSATLHHDPLPDLQHIIAENTEMFGALNAFSMTPQPHLPRPDTSTLDVHGVRADFPILRRTVHGKPLVWFDNGATTQKPQQVIDTLSHFYSHYNSNINRSAHTLAAEATDAYEGAREKVRAFIGANEAAEVVFVRGTTEAINLVAQTYGREHIKHGDEIILTVMEHHANIVPWQMLAQSVGAIIKVVDVDNVGNLRLDQYRDLFTPRTKLVAFSHVSNVLGTVAPAQEMIQIAHQHGVPVLIDGAQSVAHMPINVQQLDVDFYVFSGHKMFGPSGIGVLYGKREHLDAMPPWQGGGAMIKDVTFQQTIYNGIPVKFEAGTPIIGGAIGLGAAVDYISQIGREKIEAAEHTLTKYAMQTMQTIPHLRIQGHAPDKVGVLSFVIDGFEPAEISQHLDRCGIATRVGRHCAHPVMRRFDVEESVRASFAVYNTADEVDLMVQALRQLVI